MKLKHIENQNKRQYRLDLEKSQAKIAKLEQKIKRLEATKIESHSHIEI